MIFFEGLTLLLIYLKLTNTITISWLFVLLPLIVPFSNFLLDFYIGFKRTKRLF